jgi:alpha-beta hydrolase superfamily lysophospholipase
MERMARKHVVTGFGLVFLVLILVFLSGPRVEIDTTMHPITLPTDLEQYVAKSEAPFRDIIPGAEKTIRWAGEKDAKTPFSVIYLHGFSATRQETAPLADLVALELGANLFYTRFTGHGRSGDDAMLDGSVNAWLNDTHEAIEIGRRLGHEVLVIGVSTGATAATWAATQPIAQHVAAFVLISPNFAPADSMTRLLLWPWGTQLAELLVGQERCWKPHNERHATYWTHCYPTRALSPMMGLVSLTNSLDLGTIDTPMLVIYSPADQVVSVRGLEESFAKIGAARKYLAPYDNAADPDQHVLAGDILSPNSTEALADMIVDFVHH